MKAATIMGMATIITVTTMGTNTPMVATIMESTEAASRIRTTSTATTTVSDPSA